jgi:hypothetical protein
LKEITKTSSGRYQKALEREEGYLKHEKELKKDARYSIAVSFLTEYGSLEPAGDLLKLYMIYKTIDRFDEYIKPSERSWFPDLRTDTQFLNGFEAIFHILRGINERKELQNHWAPFWQRCMDYLKKCGYELDFIRTLEEFERYSFNWWRKEMRDDPTMLDEMFAWFRSCFGIIGNEEYCRFGDLWDWRKMERCYGDT